MLQMGKEVAASLRGPVVIMDCNEWGKPHAGISRQRAVPNAMIAEHYTRTCGVSDVRALVIAADSVDSAQIIHMLNTPTTRIESVKHVDDATGSTVPLFQQEHIALLSVGSVSPQPQLHQHVIIGDEDIHRARRPHGMQHHVVTLHNIAPTRAAAAFCNRSLLDSCNAVCFVYDSNTITQCMQTVRFLSIACGMRTLLPHTGPRATTLPHKILHGHGTAIRISHAVPILIGVHRPGISPCHVKETDALLDGIRTLFNNSPCSHLTLSVPPLSQLHSGSVTKEALAEWRRSVLHMQRKFYATLLQDLFVSGATRICVSTALAPMPSSATTTRTAEHTPTLVSEHPSHTFRSINNAHVQCDPTIHLFVTTEFASQTFPSLHSTAGSRPAMHVVRRDPPRCSTPPIKPSATSARTCVARCMDSFVRIWKKIF
jgi:hypothetical protein